VSVSEHVLDWVQTLIWPALVVVGVWVFRSPLARLLDNATRLLDRSRVKEIEVRGVKLTLEQAADVIQQNLQETRKEVDEAEDPEERERAREKLEREAAVLARVEAEARALRGNWGISVSGDYLAVLNHVLERTSIPEETKNRIVDSVLLQFERGRAAGVPDKDTIAKLGSPEAVVSWWEPDPWFAPPPPSD
jgi:hypothetical protein